MEYEANTGFTNLLGFCRDPSGESDLVDSNSPSLSSRNRKTAANLELRSINGHVAPLEYRQKLKTTTIAMDIYKRNVERERNTWQLSQRGGQGEPY